MNLLEKSARRLGLVVHSTYWTWRCLTARRAKHPPGDLLVMAGETPLFRLEFAGYSDGFFWMEYNVVCLEGTSAQWMAAAGPTSDPTQVSWDVQDVTTGRRTPLGQLFIISRDPARTVLKWLPTGPRALMMD